MADPQANPSFITTHSLAGVIAQDTMPQAEVVEAETPASDDSSAFKKGLPFWLVIASLCLIAFTSSLDGSIIAIALPQISTALSAGDQYVAVANCFLLAQTVVQPTFAQFCDIFGRRWPMIITVMIFALGSGIAGGAKSTTTMIAGRTVQGIGSGGIMLMVELIVCDLVPLRERGTYLGIVLSTAALGAIAGPVVGGAIAQANWRWCFYINLPICALVLPILIFYLRIHHLKVTWSQLLTRVDWIGNLIFMGSITAILIGLFYGGTIYPWSSWRIITPLVIGTVGWAVFHIYESKCHNPCVPPRIFRNRTTSAALYMMFVTSMALQLVCFFWPLYFLAVRGTSLMRTGINFMPFMFILIPGSAVAGILCSKTGHYRWLHLLGFTLTTLGPGLNLLLKPDTHKGVWAMLQITDALGRACILSTTLPAVLAPLPEKDVATATGMYSFLRSFGFVWGITVPSIVFNNRFDQLSWKIQDDVIRGALQGGRAYQLSAGTFLRSLPSSTQAQVYEVYLDALDAVWLVALAIGASGLVAVGIEKHVPLRTYLETEYGLDQGNDTLGPEGAAEKAASRTGDIS
ncbi:MFS general substrate transporter [Bimuria novae-zelandiae CBS 107.79]|uniref:MFS general substrate transporter n=1 Tax=Bimuria novae-zelandiae CBS 107.79 TaxID=1447943 RepID=A0A6A5VHP9_9PLEO|nr:MFS general substrate transporter [Bimuria novae-zelandiae CBS 107.79]